MAEVGIDGLMLFYEEKGQGEPVLLLHGLGSSTRDWELQMPALAERHRVVAVDLRGHGRSHKPPGPYSIPLFAADIAAFIQSLNIAPAHIIGISLGGMIAFQLALDAPELIKSLIIVNSVPQMILETFGDRLQLWRRLAIVRLLGLRRMGEFLAPRLFSKPEHELFRQQMAERWAQNDKRAYLAATKSFVGWDVSRRLGEINYPTLVVSADEDYWPLSEKEAYTAQIPNAKLLIFEDSRHATPIEYADKFNTAVLKFLEGIR
ncbi:MAG: alpha/beta fold hydrolase [Chloroflexi bacterium]|nr:alpha/beta fold hydrolase [Chloroflexota bacterium]